MKNLTFITGGARSGKSTLAQELAGKLAESRNHPVHYLATMIANGNDHEQLARIEAHKRSRPESWKTVECGSRLESAIEELPAESALVVVDCLSLFVSELLMHEDAADPPVAEEHIRQRIFTVLQAMEQRSDLDFLVVSNEVGSGVVPESQLGRAFRDALGSANQIMAKAASVVHLCVSGINVVIKDESKPGSPAAGG